MIPQKWCIVQPEAAALFEALGKEEKVGFDIRVEDGKCAGAAFADMSGIVYIPVSGFITSDYLAEACRELISSQDADFYTFAFKEQQNVLRVTDFGNVC